MSSVTTVHRAALEYWLTHYQPSQQEIIVNFYECSPQGFTFSQERAPVSSSSQPRPRLLAQLWMPHFTGSLDKLECTQRKSIRMVTCHMKNASQTGKSSAWRRKDGRSLPRAGFWQALQERGRNGVAGRCLLTSEFQTGERPPPEGATSFQRIVYHNTENSEKRIPIVKDLTSKAFQFNARRS